METKKLKYIDTLFMLLIFFLFTLLSLLVILIGARAYDSIVKDMDRNNQMRASLSYVANKVRAGDEADAINIRNLQNTDVLTIRADYGGEPYLTYIYFYNGCIWEQFTKADQTFRPGSGDKITPIKSFRFSKDGGNQLCLSAEDDSGRKFAMQVALRSEGKAA